jgi:translation elongation factor P/translation initiation factor 5A
VFMDSEDYTPFSLHKEAIADELLPPILKACK